MNRSAAHTKLVKAALLALHRVPDTRAFELTQYRGKTVRRIDGQEVIGPWLNAGMNTGAFDIFVCSQGRVIWLDAKTGSARLSKEQRAFQRWIRMAGGVAEPFSSVTEAIRIVEGAHAS